MAASRFSSQHTGALIVMERDTGLRTYTESGISLRAQLSYDLLVAIFQPHAPLHDGAVIIRKNKIIAAACFLPLTVNPVFWNASRHAAPGGRRDHRGDRRGGCCRLGGERRHLPGQRRVH